MTARPISSTANSAAPRRGRACRTDPPRRAPPPGIPQSRDDGDRDQRQRRTQRGNHEHQRRPATPERRSSNGPARESVRAVRQQPGSTARSGRQRAPSACQSRGGQYRLARENTAPRHCGFHSRRRRTDAVVRPIAEKASGVGPPRSRGPRLTAMVQLVAPFDKFASMFDIDELSRVDDTPTRRRSPRRIAELERVKSAAAAGQARAAAALDAYRRASEAAAGVLRRNGAAAWPVRSPWPGEILRRAPADIWDLRRPWSTRCHTPSRRCKPGSCRSGAPP